MSTTSTSRDAALVDYAKSLDCVHCGLCLNSCPTYRLTGAESSSPRGRIHLMRAVAEGTLAPDRDFAEEMSFCLLCRGCESVCPSGVQFGAMMEHTRDALVRRGDVEPSFVQRVALRRILPSRSWIRWSVRFGRLMQLLETWRIFFTHLGKRGRFLADAPPIPPARERRLLPSVTRASAPRTGSVAFLEGCVMPELYGRVNRAGVEVLSRCGFDVHVPSDHACCGSLQAHNGELPTARELARRTIEAFERTGALSEPAGDGRPLTIVVDSAGCSAHMKEYAQLFDDGDPWKERARAFSARVRDFSEFLDASPARAALQRALDAAPRPVGTESVTYDDPCHLCHAQKIRAQPRRLIDALPGIERREMPDAESCCGSAGIYTLLRPADSEAVLDPKLASLAASGARTLVVANPGCQMQWETGLRRTRGNARVVHLAELLEERTRPANPSSAR